MNYVLISPSQSNNLNGTCFCQFPWCVFYKNGDAWPWRSSEAWKQSDWPRKFRAEHLPAIAESIRVTKLIRKQASRAGHQEHRTSSSKARNVVYLFKVSSIGPSRKWISKLFSIEAHLGFPFDVFVHLNGRWNTIKVQRRIEKQTFVKLRWDNACDPSCISLDSKNKELTLCTRHEVHVEREEQSRAKAHWQRYWKQNTEQSPRSPHKDRSHPKLQWEAKVRN